MVELCHYCSSGRFVLNKGEWVCNNCGVIDVKEEEYHLQPFYSKISDADSDIPPLPSTKKIKNNIDTYDMIEDYIKPRLKLNSSICQEIKRLFNKSKVLGIPYRDGTNRRHFYVSESVGACTYIAILLSGKKDIVTELIAKELNQIFQAVKINRIKYKDIKPDRIRRCAIILKEELRLQVKIPEIPIPIDRNTLKIQHDKIDTAICDITEKLGLKPGKVLSKFEYKLKELGISLVANKGHKRAPNVVAAGLIFKVHRNKVTIRNLNKAAGCGNKSLQKILRLLAVSIYKETA